MDQAAVSLIIGADGMIGRALAAHLTRAGASVWETSRRLDTVSERRLFVDLTGDVSGWQPPCRVSVAYLCAAVTSLERCQANAAQTAAVNVHGTVALAKTLVAQGAFVIFLSTNLVYDGSVPFRKASDPTCPRTEYGRQKAEAERQLLTLGNAVSIVRFTKVLGPGVPLFRRWIQALHGNEAIHPFSDMVLAPVPLPFAVDVLGRIAEAHLSGIVQVSGERDVSYEVVGRRIAWLVGACPELIQPKRSARSDLLLEAVPTYTTLDSTRLRTELGMEPPDIWQTVDSVVDP